MKRSGTSYEALSPRSSEYQLQYPPITAIEQQIASNAQTSDFAEYFEDALGPTQNLDSLQQLLGSYVEPYDAQANTSNQSDFASSSVGAQRDTSQAQQSLPQHSEGAVRGIVNCAESPGLIRATRETRSAYHHFSGTTAASPYNTCHRSYSVTSQRSALTPMPNPLAASAESTDARPTPYSPYRGLFPNSNAARDHRHLSTRFGRQPYILPEDDHTIEEVERNRNYHVGRIYDAMIWGDRAQDNAGSIAMKRWVNGAHYKSDLIEAFAHKVFDCLLVQVKEGFRGWHHNDYVDDDRKGEKEDREADCSNRLENIIDALEREKTICEDVVNSASQIRMFVNAPIAYAARKYQNRQGNSKRGRTKDASDSDRRPTKVRRTGGRQLRNRSTATPDVLTSRDTTPQFQMPASSVTPYYTSGTSQHLPSSPTSTHLAPPQSLRRSAMSMPQVPTGYRQATATAPLITVRPYMPPSAASMAAMSPPVVPASRPYNSHATMIPQAQMLPSQVSPLASTPSQSYVYHSASPSPDDVKYPIPGSSPEDWPTGDTFDTACTPIDPSLTTNDLFFTRNVWSSEPEPVQATDGTSDFDQQLLDTHISLADIEHVALQTVSHGNDDPVNAFESLWNAQPGVQPFSFDEPVNDNLDQH